MPALRLSRAAVIVIVVMAAAAVGVLAWRESVMAPGSTKNAKANITGLLTLTSGNCMPVIGDGKGSSCKSAGVSRKVYFYKPALSTNDMTGSHYTGSATPAAYVTSGSDGNYEMILPAGTYSVLAEDTGGPFCNLSDGDTACPLVVTGLPQRHDVSIDHATH